MPSFCASMGLVTSTVAPFSVSVPRVGRWTPARILAKVDLPAPFSPRSAWISPASGRDRRRSALRPRQTDWKSRGPNSGSTARCECHHPLRLRPAWARRASISPARLQIGPECRPEFRESSEATFCATSDGRAAPGMIGHHRRMGEHELQGRGGQGDVVLRQTASMPRTFACTCGRGGGITVFRVAAAIRSRGCPDAKGAPMMTDTPRRTQSAMPACRLAWSTSV